MSKKKTLKSIECIRFWLTVSFIDLDVEIDDSYLDLLKDPKAGEKWVGVVLSGKLDLPSLKRLKIFLRVIGVRERLFFERRSQRVVGVVRKSVRIQPLLLSALAWT